ncbi:hypothetical protein ACFVH0_38915 [Streptomyces sp. NPDC127117]|uniref:hypothetical protein n=1 Tax=Streptomyces sp. NPDC127117 TaxID=3345368 RepID=UPI00362835B2
MKIELLVVADCPNEQPAAELIGQALRDVGLPGAGFTTRVIADRGDAVRAGFTGSPTVLVDGRDPFAEEGQEPGLACRVYRSPQGLSGVPPLEELRQALREAGAAEPPR